jgi:hypothetical protein
MVAARRSTSHQRYPPIGLSASFSEDLGRAPSSRLTEGNAALDHAARLLGVGGESTQDKANVALDPVVDARG